MPRQLLALSLGLGSGILPKLGCVVICPMIFTRVGEGALPDAFTDPTKKKHSGVYARVDRFMQRHPRSCGMAKMLYDAQLYGQASILEFHNHHQGHTVPPPTQEFITRWLARHEIQGS